MESRGPRRELRFAMADSRRWRDFTHRADDIFIVTPPKCGTTWMQGIVASLLWPDGDAPGLPGAVSPWIEQRVRPIAEVLDELDATPWRRFIKSHSPLDCIPFFSECTYIAVFRTPVDALASWANHRGSMRPEIWEHVDATAPADGIEPSGPWSGDLHDLFDEWVAHRQSPWQQLGGWWEVRNEPNVLLVHYRDLLADLSGEMRRVAEHLTVSVPADRWADVVGRCEFDDYKAAYAASGRMAIAFEDGADSFFHRGASRSGVDELPPEILARCLEFGASVDLPGEAREWLERGSIHTASRP